MMRGIHAGRGLAIGASLAGALLVCDPSSSLAQAETADRARRRARLSYERAESATGCIDEEEFRGQVGARLGYDPFVESAELAVRVELAREGSTWRARIETARAEREPAERRLEAPAESCEELSRSVVLAVTIAIDPAVLGADEPEPVAEAAEVDTVVVETVVAPAAIGPAAPEPTEPAVANTMPVGAALFVGATGTLGASPTLGSFGLQLGVDLRWDHLLVGLAVRGDLPGAIEIAGGTVDAHVLAAELAVCGRWAPFLACGVGAFGVMRAAGHDLRDAREVVLPHVALGVRAGLELALGGPIALRINLDVLGHVTQSTIEVGDAAAWSMPPLSGMLSLWLVVSLV
jgi:hypothetical protein